MPREKTSQGSRPKDGKGMKGKLIITGLLTLAVCMATWTIAEQEAEKGAGKGATAPQGTNQKPDARSFLDKFFEAIKAGDQDRMEELVRQAGPQIVYDAIVSESTRGITSVAEGKDGSMHLNTAEAMATLYAKEFKKGALLEQVRKYKLYDQQMSQEKLKADALVREGLSFYRKSQWEESQRQFNEALVAFDKIGDLFGRSKALTYIGDTNMQLGHYDRALRIYQQNLELKRTIGDLRGEATALSNMGAIYQSLKQYDKALKFYNQSIEEYQKMKDQAEEAGLLKEIENIREKLKRDSQER